MATSAAATYFRPLEHNGYALPEIVIHQDAGSDRHSRKVDV